MIPEKIKQHGYSAMIATIVSTMIVVTAIWAASARYTKLEAGLDTTCSINDKQHAEMKADTNAKFEELKKEVSAMRENQEKQTQEIIRAIGRLEGKLDK